MKKLILFPLAFLAILAPNVALSQTPMSDITGIEDLNLSEEDAKIVYALACKYKNENPSEEYLNQKLSDLGIPEANKLGITNAVLDPEELEALESIICAP